MSLRMSRKFCASVCFALIATLTADRDCQALEVLFDNFSAESAGNTPLSDSQWPAQAFTTNSDGYELSEISLRLWNSSSTTGEFQIQIWNANGTGGSPGAQVGTAIYQGNAGSLSSTPGNLLTVSDLSVPLTANVTYYLLLRGVNLTMDIGDGPEPGFLNWGRAATNTTPNYIAANSGSTWFGPYSSNMTMRVTAVPEPSTWALGLLGAAALGLVRRRGILTAAA